MSGYDITFARPAYLLLLLLTPVLWLMAARSLAAMGRMRSFLAVVGRTVLFVMIVCALAEIQFVRSNQRLAVIYLVDRSLSIPRDRLDRVIDYVNASMHEQRRAPRGDYAGVISFGRDAAVEIPALDHRVTLPKQFETLVDPNHTDLATALRLAQAAFPADAAKRVVVISDGNETLGDALAQARALAEEGIGIDVVPVRYTARSDVAVESVATPSAVRLSTPFDVRVVLVGEQAEGDDGQPIPGTLTIFREAQGDRQLVATSQVHVRPGKQVFSFRDEIDRPGFFSYTARFASGEGATDAVSQNNLGTSFTQVRGHGSTLVIVDSERPHEFDEFAELLRKEKIHVTIQPSSQLFTSLAELQSYDVVVLANVPRSSGAGEDDVSIFSDEQLRILAENTQKMGCGLMMIGGRNSFGVGGWAKTPVEEAMPVDFQVKNAKVVPSGALMLVIDSSGSMTGQKIDICKSAAMQAVKVLGDRDFIGVYSFDSEAHRVVPIQPASQREQIARTISRLSASGGTNMYPAMLQGYRALESVQAATKHMIVLTDGQTAPADYRRLAAEMHAKGITVTAVAIGTDADAALLNAIAQRGGGKFYRVNSLRAIPRIFIHEARRVARPLIFEDERGFTPELASRQAYLAGIDGPLPPITGFVMTTPKDNPLVEVAMTSPVPDGQTNVILATWQYGLGRSVALTTDTGQGWAQPWTGWEGRGKLLLQLVRWAMRPTDDAGRFTVATRVRDKRVEIVLTELEREAGDRASLHPEVTCLGPEMQSITTSLRKEAPGRYVGSFDAPAAGSYFVAVAPGGGQAPLRLGVNVGYSDEFRSRGENLPKLVQLAGLTPKGGAAGTVIEVSHGELADVLADADLFREGLAWATSRQAGWYLLVLAACCLFAADVFNRRVAWGLAWMPRLFRSLILRRTVEMDANPAMERLRHRKAEVQAEWAGRRVDMAEADLLSDTSSVASGDVPATTPTTEQARRSLADALPADDDQDYIERLLRAKREAAKQGGEVKRDD